MSRPHIFVLNERDLDNPLAGGAEVHLFEIFGRLAERGFPVTLVCAGFRGATPRARMRGVAIERVGNRYTYYARAPGTFRRLARGVRPAVLVENLNKLPFYGPLYSPLPVVAVVHHLFGTTAFRQVSFPIAAATWLAELGIPPIYRGVPMIAISPSTRDDLIGRGVPAADITLIPNGLDHALYRPDASTPAGPMLLSLGRIEPYKRIDVAVRAMATIRAAVPAARLVIVGRGEAVPGLERLTSRLGLGDAVAFKGFVTEEEKVALYRQARVFVNPSEKEGWGLTVLEANACGTPAVASDSPGLRDSVRHGETGVLVPHGDVAAFAAAAIRLLRDDDEWRRLRAGAIEWAAAFDWERVTDETEALIERAADGAR